MHNFPLKLFHYTSQSFFNKFISENMTTKKFRKSDFLGYKVIINNQEIKQ